jgi:hypothetical protein
MEPQRIDIPINRSATISLPNFKSIKPTVGITAKNVPADKMAETYEKISQGLDALWGLEILAIMTEMEAINSRGLEAYVSALRRAEDTMHAVLAKVSQSLNIEATASVEQIDAPENGGRP